MHIKTRLNRLDRRLAAPPEQRGFDAVMADMQALGQWLDEQGFEDYLAVLEAKATPPIGCEALLASQAKHDPRRRAWKRVEGLLHSGELPAEADVALLGAVI